MPLRWKISKQKDDCLTVWRLRSFHSPSACWLRLKEGAPRVRSHLTPGIRARDKVTSALHTSGSLHSLGLALPNYLDFSPFLSSIILSLQKRYYDSIKKKFAPIFSAYIGNASSFGKFEQFRKIQKVKTLVYLGCRIFIQYLSSSLWGHSCADMPASLVVSEAVKVDKCSSRAWLIGSLPCNVA